MVRTLALALLLALTVAAPSGAQFPGELPERIEVDDLLSSPGLYSDKLVLVVGELRTGDMVDTQNDVYELRDSNGLRSVRVGEPWGSMRQLRWLTGQKVEIIGIFWDLFQAATKIGGQWRPIDPRLRDFPGALRPDLEQQFEKNFFIGVQSADSLEEDLIPAPDEALEKEDLPEPDIEVAPGDVVDLRELVRTPESYSGERIAVIGKFRGNTLYGDLSIRTKKTPRDFVLKVADVAIWVTGKRPRGKGFRLDPKLRRDTGKWLRVIGRPWMDGGVVYLKAEKIELAPKPDEPGLEPVEVSEEEEANEPGPPPEVIFSLPLDGERNIPLDTEFRVQFSKDMSRESFDRNVDLLYADDDGKVDPFPDIEISYDVASRTLVVIPGTRLKPGKEIRLILYGGIADTEGQFLTPQAGADAEAGAAVIFSFSTAR
ncbi:MAG: Ig-like domain-containing protein [Acidobacteriota bacterium]